MFKKNILRGITAASVATMLFAATAFAGTSTTGYNTTVGKFNGSGYSDYQTKAISGANGWIYSTRVGGNYTVDVRMNSSAGNGSWLRNLNDGTSASLPGNSAQTAGKSIRLKFSNDITTPVNVQVEGSWKSN
ncbi:MAG: hypothetical protein K2N51_19825 [Lachnospiraceae bacterium]|nr:hypothetical protein [Lachnospiraceae bacterium]